MIYSIKNILVILWLFVWSHRLHWEKVIFPSVFPSLSNECPSGVEYWVRQLLLFFVNGFGRSKYFYQNFLLEHFGVVFDIIWIVPGLVQYSFDKFVIPMLIFFILLNMFLQFYRFCLIAKTCCFTQVLRLFFSIPVV